MVICFGFWHQKWDLVNHSIARCSFVTGGSKWSFHVLIGSLPHPEENILLSHRGRPHHVSNSCHTHFFHLLWAGFINVPRFYLHADLYENRLFNMHICCLFSQQWREMFSCLSTTLLWCKYLLGTWTGHVNRFIHPSCPSVHVCDDIWMNYWSFCLHVIIYVSKWRKQTYLSFLRCHIPVVISNKRNYHRSNTFVPNYNTALFLLP